MSFRNVLQTLIVPDGAGTGDARLVVTATDLPEPLKGDGYDAAIIMYTSGTADDTYLFIAWDLEASFGEHIMTIGYVLNGAYVLNPDGTRSFLQTINSGANAVQWFMQFSAQLTQIFEIDGENAGLHLITGDDLFSNDFKVSTNTGTFPMGRGVRRFHVQTTDGTTASTTLVDWFSLTLTGLQTNRLYEIELIGNATASTSGNTAICRLTDGANNNLPSMFSSGHIQLATAGQFTNFNNKSYYLSASESDFTIKTRIFRATGAGTVTFDNAIVKVTDITDHTNPDANVYTTG